jgi:hypothetical protein
MKKTIITIAIIISSFGFAQTTLGNPYNNDIYGVYKSSDGTQVLEMFQNPDNTSTFIRTTPDGTITGTFEQFDNTLHVNRASTSYDLNYYLEQEHLIVIKPEEKPLLFVKICE